jgi:hypothetical protein
VATVLLVQGLIEGPAVADTNVGDRVAPDELVPFVDADVVLVPVVTPCFLVQRAPSSFYRRMLGCPSQPSGVLPSLEQLTPYGAFRGRSAS